MQQNITTWGTVAINSLNAMGLKIMSFLPNLIGVVILFLIAIFVAGLLRKLVVKALQAAKVDGWPERFFGAEKAKIFVDRSLPSIVAGQVIYWLTILIFLVTIAETLGWQVVSEKTGELIGYLPRLFSAVLIFIIGYYIANFVKNAIAAGLGSVSREPAASLSRIVFIIMIVFISITALDQAGVDTSLITTNISIIIGAMMLAFAVAFAFSAKPFLANILSFLYNRERFQVGQQVTMGDVKGEVVQFDHMHFVVRSGNDEVVIPTRELAEQRVRVHTENEE